MGKNKVMCISRQVGSDGRVIGRAVAEREGIAYYDKELLTEALKSTDVSPELIERYDEKKVNAWLHTLIYEGSDQAQYGRNGSDLLFSLQKSVILQHAHEGPCVIIGRCADAILEKEEDVEVLSIFLAAPLQDRIDRVMKRDHISMKEATSQIEKTDKNRRAHYEFYAEKQWGDPSEYDLMINTSAWERGQLIDMLCGLYEHFGGKE